MKVKAERIGQMLVGSVLVSDEPALFDFLCSIEAGCVIDVEDKIGCCYHKMFDIELVDPHCKPAQHAVHWCSRLKHEFINKPLPEMLRMDVIEPILSDWHSGVVVAPKPGKGEGLRLCFDLADVNSLTKKVKFTIPNMDEIL